MAGLPDTVLVLEFLGRVLRRITSGPVPVPQPQPGRPSSPSVSTSAVPVAVAVAVYTPTESDSVSTSNCTPVTTAVAADVPVQKRERPFRRTRRTKLKVLQVLRARFVSLRPPRLQRRSKAPAAEKDAEQENSNLDEEEWTRIGWKADEGDGEGVCSGVLSEGNVVNDSGNEIAGGDRGLGLGLEGSSTGAVRQESIEEDGEERHDGGKRLTEVEVVCRGTDEENCEGEERSDGGKGLTDVVCREVDEEEGEENGFSAIHQESDQGGAEEEGELIEEGGEDFEDESGSVEFQEANEEEEPALLREGYWPYCERREVPVSKAPSEDLYTIEEEEEEEGEGEGGGQGRGQSLRDGPFVGVETEDGGDAIVLPAGANHGGVCQRCLSLEGRIEDLEATVDALQDKMQAQKGHYRRSTEELEQTVDVLQGKQQAAEDHYRSLTEELEQTVDVLQDKLQSQEAHYRRLTDELEERLSRALEEGQARKPALKLASHGERLLRRKSGLRNLRVEVDASPIRGSDEEGDLSFDGIAFDDSRSFGERSLEGRSRSRSLDDEETLDEASIEEPFVAETSLDEAGAKAKDIMDDDDMSNPFEVNLQVQVRVV